ncbi:MAG: hypothetical protein KJ896_02125, partial [Nanoarchaeota archaeon]|nr:hypothetical protein [Nanoarchaeota archaeon]
KETQGIAIVDPRFVPNAKIVKHATFSEIREGVYRSAKAVLEPSSLKWCHEKGVPVRVMSLSDTANSGTLITNHRDMTDHNEIAISNIACKEGFIIYVCSRRESDDSFFSDLFKMFSSNGVSIDMVDTNNGTVSLAIHESEFASLDERIRLERGLRERSGNLGIYDNQALISIVGEGIKRPVIFKNWITKVPESVTACYGPILGGVQTGMTTFYIELFGMHDQVGYAERLAEFFESNGIKIAACSTSIDSFSVGVKEDMSRDYIAEISSKFKDEVKADDISVTRNGVYRYGSNRDVRNITLAVPASQVNDAVVKIYNKLLEEEYIV